MNHDSHHEHENSEQQLPAARPAGGETEPSPERTTRPRPRIYVASLADYNNGRLHGEWIDAARPAEQLYADITAILARSREPDAEEFAIHDFDGFGALRLGECESIPRVVQLARGIVDHGDAFAAWADAHEDQPDLLDAFTEKYLGHYATLHDYAEQVIADLGYHQLLEDSIPESLRPYARIDTEALARDMYLEGSIDVYPDDEDGVWLFDAR